MTLIQLDEKNWVDPQVVVAISGNTTALVDIKGDSGEIRTLAVEGKTPAEVRSLLK